MEGQLHQVLVYSAVNLMQGIRVITWKGDYFRPCIFSQTGDFPQMDFSLASRSQVDFPSGSHRPAVSFNQGNHHGGGPLNHLALTTNNAGPGSECGKQSRP